MKPLSQFSKQQYLNIETFRKSGISVKTPVWFVQEGDSLFVRTLADSGKVKRIRNNGRVSIAPCKMDGTLVGEWKSAYAREVRSPDTARTVDRLLSKKYGVLKTMFALVSTLRGQKYTVLEIKAAEPEPGIDVSSVEVELSAGAAR